MIDTSTAEGKMWLILADDLTGAADCAIAFASRGVPTLVGWGGAQPDPPDEIFAFDAGSRGLSAAKLAICHQTLFGKFTGRRLFAKIDSTLRGQPAAAIAAALRAASAHDPGAIGVLAPAFPAAGRTTQGGRVLVDGVPLEQTELWRRDRSEESADLQALLAAAGLQGHPIRLETVREGDLAPALRAVPSGSIAVCDALTQHDLARIARNAPPGACFIGAAGLAHALAEAVPPRLDAYRLPPGGKPALIVVGSLAPVSRAAARALAALDGVRHLPVAPDTLPDNTLARATIEALAAGYDVLVELQAGAHPDLTQGPRLAAALAASLKPAAAHLGALVATGGETAAALLAALGVNAIRLIRELEPGLPLGVTQGALEVPLATKAGGFGDRASLARTVCYLRRIRQQGFPT